MSQENLQLVARVLQEGHDDPSALFAIVDEDALWESGPHEIPDGPATYRGPSGVQEFLGRWVGAFEEWGYEGGELIDAGEAVVFHMRQWGRGKGSGVPVTNDFWQVWRIREGKLIHRSRFADKASALKAMGLPE